MPPFSWIDPNFKDMNLVGSPSSDDHPPSDVKDGQELVSLAYNALASNPGVWEKSRLIVVYDEHGGFYDHMPPEAPDDDPENFGCYGVRVPALVVSPWVEPASVGKDRSTTPRSSRLSSAASARASSGGARVPAPSSTGLRRATPTT